MSGETRSTQWIVAPSRHGYICDRSSRGPGQRFLQPRASRSRTNANACTITHYTYARTHALAHTHTYTYMHTQTHTRTQQIAPHQDFAPSRLEVCSGVEVLVQGFIYVRTEKCHRSLRVGQRWNIGETLLYLCVGWTLRRSLRRERPEPRRSGLEIHAAILRCHEIPDILGGKRCLLAPNSPLSKKRVRTPSPPQPLSGIKGRRGRSVDVRRRRHASILSLVSLPESQAWPE